MKIKVFRDHTISMSGVEKVWAWECPHNGCKILRTNYNQSMFWENTVRGAFQHLNWHRSFASA